MYTRKIKVRRSYSCNQQPERIKDTSEEPASVKCVNCETQKDFKDGAEEKECGSQCDRDQYQSIESSISSIEEVMSDNFMIISPHEKHSNTIVVEVEMHPIKAKEESLPKPLGSAGDVYDSDDSSANTPLCVSYSV